LLCKQQTDEFTTGISGMGEHPSGDWPGEGTVLVLGLSPEAAKSLGQQT
jgi:hypothetical protein